MTSSIADIRGCRVRERWFGRAVVDLLETKHDVRASHQAHVRNATQWARHANTVSTTAAVPISTRCVLYDGPTSAITAQWTAPPTDTSAQNGNRHDSRNTLIVVKLTS